MRLPIDAQRIKTIESINISLGALAYRPLVLAPEGLSLDWLCHQVLQPSV
jgi:hypothetical protein